MDGLEAIGIVGKRVADHAGIVPEQPVEHVDIVGADRFLIALEGGRHLGHHVGDIDLHGSHLFVVEAGTEWRTPSRSTPAMSGFKRVVKARISGGRLAPPSAGPWLSTC